MKRFLFGLIIVCCITAVGLYIFNPSGTSSSDPRGRIFGHIPYRIPAASMEPTLMVGDSIIASTFAYAGSSPKHGDVITFRYPPDPKQTYVKRVIGVAGDYIEIRGHEVFRNGRALNEPYAQHTQKRERGGQWTVPSSMVFVLGDNRDNSADSRIWGFVPHGLIEGKVTYVWMSEHANTGPISTSVSN